MTEGSYQALQIIRINKFSWDPISLVTFIQTKRDSGIFLEEELNMNFNDGDILPPNRRLEGKGMLHPSTAVTVPQEEIDRTKHLILKLKLTIRSPQWPRSEMTCTSKRIQSLYEKKSYYMLMTYEGCIVSITKLENTSLSNYHKSTTCMFAVLQHIYL